MYPGTWELIDFVLLKAIVKFFREGDHYDKIVEFLRGLGIEI